MRARAASSSSRRSVQAGRPGKLAHRSVHSGQGRQLPLRGARLPGVQLVPAGPGRLPAPVRTAPALGLAGRQRGLLGHGPQRPLGRLPAVPLPVLLRHAPHLGRDLRTARGEGVHDGLVHSANLESVTVRAGHQDVAQAGQTGGQLPRGVGRHGQALLVKHGPVQCPPAGVRLVPPLGQVHDRNVDVELGVTLAGRVLQERRGHRAGRVPVLRALRPGPHVQSALHPSNGRPSGTEQRVRDRAGLDLQRPSVLIRSGLAQPPSVRQQRGVQDTDGLGRAHGEVEVRDA